MLPPAGPPPPYGSGPPPPYGSGPPAVPPRPAPAARPPPRSNNGSGFMMLLMLMIGILGGSTCAALVTLSGGAGSERILYGQGERVGVIELLGPITSGDDVTRNIREFARRDDLVAIVLRIDSPGGAVAPSQEIYQALREAAKVKPVVASMGSAAASGGFWVSLGADWVFASPGTITGSIGVISQNPDLSELAELARFKMRTYKSGPVKDMGNPFRAATEADHEVIMALIEDVYDQFVSLTAERRGLPKAEVLKLADGRIMSGRAAFRADLVDELGGLWDAARKAVLLAQAKEAKDSSETVDTSSAAYGGVEDPTLVYPKPPKPALLDLLQSRAQDAVSEGLVGAAERLMEAERAPVELR